MIVYTCFKQRNPACEPREDEAMCRSPGVAIGLPPRPITMVTIKRVVKCCQASTLQTATGPTLRRRTPNKPSVLALALSNQPAAR
jgi:hypothetical protein